MHIRSLLAMALLSALPACRRCPTTVGGQKRSLETKRNDARAVLERHCGTCHREDSPTAQARALAIFNLNDLDWSWRASDAQLQHIRFRVENLRPMAGEPGDFDLGSFGKVTTPAEVEAVRLFVDAEIAARARATSGALGPPAAGKRQSAGTPAGSARRGWGVSIQPSMI
jgi:hypothetical protein